MTEEEKDLFITTIKDMLNAMYYRSIYTKELGQIFGVNLSITLNDSLFELHNIDKILVHLLFNISKTYGNNKEDRLAIDFEDEVLRQIGNTTIENLNQQAVYLFEFAINAI